MFIKALFMPMQTSTVQNSFSNTYSKKYVLQQYLNTIHFI